MSLPASLAFAQSGGGGVRQQLEELASLHGFTVQHLDGIADAPPKRLQGALAQQIRALLESYNYVLYHDAEGVVERVVITSRKAPVRSPPRKIRITTERRGNHHVVRAMLVGPNAARVPTSLLLDTGASTVVLPGSLIDKLGFAGADLTEGAVQTAHGKVAAKLGILPLIELGGTLVDDVLVTFLPDEHLGGNMLLGMSLLDRFRVTIDDDRNEIILDER